MSTPAALNFIHRFLPGTSSRTLLLLHGTGGNEADLIQFGRALDSEAKLLSPRGKVSEDGMPRFFQRLAEGVFDEEDLIRRTHELADFIEQAAVYYGFDPQKAVAVGYSNGANIAGALLLLRPGRSRSLPEDCLFGEPRGRCLFFSSGASWSGNRPSCLARLPRRRVFEGIMAREARLNQN